MEESRSSAALAAADLPGCLRWFNTVLHFATMPKLRLMSAACTLGFTTACALAFTSLAGCCCLSPRGTGVAQHSSAPALPARPAAALASHRPPTPGVFSSELAARAEEVLRGQSPDDGGMFDVPTWSEIRKSKRFNSFFRLFGYDVNEEKARQEFEQAEELFREGKYRDAAGYFKKAGNHWPDSELEEDALFMLGECEFFSDRYPAASDAYTNLLAKFENSRHLDRVVQRQFAVARYWTELNRVKPHRTMTPNVVDKTRPFFDTPGEALANFESVRLHDPTGGLADDSVMATANAYFVDDRYDDADYYYGILRSDYPKSEHLKQAYLLGLRAKLRKYAGPQYDSTPLTEAEELIQQMLTQFPTELGDERERVVQAGRSVRAQLAQRDWEMGEFYHKTAYYGAAGYYYNNVVKEYSDTQFASLAQQRLEEIKDKPPSPPRRWDWIEDVIPGRSRRRK